MPIILRVNGRTIQIGSRRESGNTVSGNAEELVVWSRNKHKRSLDFSEAKYRARDLPQNWCDLVIIFMFLDFLVPCT